MTTDNNPTPTPKRRGDAREMVFARRDNDGPPEIILDGKRYNIWGKEVGNA